MGQYFRAETAIQKTVSVRVDSLGEEDCHTLNSMGILALVYHNQGRWKQAEELGVRVVKDSGQLSSPDTSQHGQLGR
ncbi:hypothetical protein LX36DRAFT_657411 [Colletotrichum falcatum]|nr:hypothetical protein LX36DRAFT_657411 [Colletotrichum falcatum]